jgi:tetratricopeptide (TPR) repeat protein
MGEKDFDKTDIEELIERYDEARKQGEYLQLEIEEIADIVGYLRDKEDLTKAKEVMDYALTLYPNDIELLVNLAYLCLDMEDLESAKQAAERIEEQDEPDVVMLNLEIAINMGDTDKVEFLWHKLDDHELHATEVVLDMADLFRTKGMAQRGIEWLDKVVEEERDDTDYLCVLADCYSECEEYNEKAIELYNKLIDRNPFDVLYWVQLAKCYYTAERYSDAIEACDYAFAVKPDCGEAYAIQGHCYMQQEDYAKSSECFRKSISYGGVVRAMNHAFLATSLVSEERFAEAKKEYEAAFRFAAEDGTDIEFMLPELYGGYAKCLAQTNDFEGSYDMLQRSIDMAPDNFDSYMTAAKICTLHQDKNFMKKIVKKALPLVANVEDLAMLAHSLLSVGLYKEAIPHMLRLYKKMPDDPYLIADLAHSYIQIGDFDNYVRFNEKLGKARLSPESIYGIYCKATELEVLPDKEEFIGKINQAYRKYMEELENKGK